MHNIILQFKTYGETFNFDSVSRLCCGFAVDLSVVSMVSSRSTVGSSASSTCWRSGNSLRIGLHIVAGAGMTVVAIKTTILNIFPFMVTL